MDDGIVADAVTRLLPNQLQERWELPHIERHGKFFSSVWLNHEQA
jgi:hypothetical protein